MEKVEQDLEKSRTSREKQAKEFTRQIENERARHEKLVRCSISNEMSMKKNIGTFTSPHYFRFQS